MDKEMYKSKLTSLIEIFENEIDYMYEQLSVNALDYSDEEVSEIENYIEFTAGKVDGFKYVIRMLDCEEEV